MLPTLRIRGTRALLSVGALAVVYGVAAEIGRGRLPDRIWLGTHYVENVQLLPPYRSLLEETVFLLESGILPSSVAVVTLLGAHQGVRSVPRVYLEAASALGASPGLAFRKIALPAALPYIF